MTLIPPKVCPECGEPYTPMPRYDRTVQVTCGKKRCKFGRLSRQRRGQVPVAAVAARKRRAQTEVERALREQFGALSEREAAIYQLGRVHGYSRGYAVAYHKQFPRKTA